MRRDPTGRASVERPPSTSPETTPSVPDDPALALVRTPRAREITYAQIVQSIIQRGIE